MGRGPLNGFGLLLAPGAGADSKQATLVALDAAVTGAGGVVERMDFPYRLAGRRAPDREPVLLDAVRSAAAGLTRRRGVRHLVMGGRSMGGRICSMVAADGVEAAGLVLISYPLHPPGKPERLRTAHFPDLAMPCLFVSGTKDAFGTPAELEGATAVIPGPVRHVWIEGKDHSLRSSDPVVAGALVVRLVEVAGG